MGDKITLSEAGNQLPELAYQTQAGMQYILTHDGHDLAMLIGIDEYHRLIAIEMEQRQSDYDTLLAPRDTGTLSEDEARQLAVQIIREKRRL